ncbi:MAG: hypothetical protein ACLU8F_06335 [Clostridia bacterium]
MVVVFIFMGVVQLNELSIIDNKEHSSKILEGCSFNKLTNDIHIDKIVKEKIGGIIKRYDTISENIYKKSNRNYSRLFKTA